MMHTARRTAAAFAVAAATALALFATPSATADAVPGLSGRTFVSTTVKPRPIPGGGKLEINFGQRNRVSLHAGCNRQMGTVRAVGRRLVFSPLASTRMACPGPRERADSWVTNFARQSPVYRLNGSTLTLSTRTSTVVLREERPTRPGR